MGQRIKKFLNWWLCDGNPDKKGPLDWLLAAQHHPIWIRLNTTGSNNRFEPLGLGLSGASSTFLLPDDPLS